MISKCANPDCATAFHYLRGGKLYRFDLRHPHEPCADVPNAICANRPAHASVYFWLCADCSRRYTVRFALRKGVSVVPTTFVPEHCGPVVVHVADAE